MMLVKEEKKTAMAKKEDEDDLQIRERSTKSLFSLNYYCIILYVNCFSLLAFFLSITKVTIDLICILSV